MFQAVGMLDTHLAIILLYAVANMPIVVWLMYDFFRNLPIELEESAQLDGATRLRIFLEIVLPLTRPWSRSNDIVDTCALLERIPICCVLGYGQGPDNANYGVSQKYR